MELDISQVFSFGGADLSGMLLVKDVTRQVSPSRRYSQTTVPGMDGSHVSGSALDAYELSVACVVLADDETGVEEIRRTLATALTAGEQRLMLPGDGLYRMARYKGGSALDGLTRHPAVTLSFLCADPVAYGQPRSETVSTTAKTVRAGGNYKAFPRVTCKPSSGSYWALTNIDTGAFVRVEAAFTGAQTVVLDMRNERCTVNGADHPVTVTSDFFAIDGSQQIKTSSGTATLEWEERWL